LCARTDPPRAVRIGAHAITESPGQAICANVSLADFSVHDRGVISPVRIERVGEFCLGWGESVVWDERKARLYFVDCSSRTLHWLDGGEGTLNTLELPSMATGIVPTDEGTLVGAFEDGLHVIDPDTGATHLLTAYPPGLGGRANDACADLAGNLITGKLNLAGDEGSAWWYSRRKGWRLLDPCISNTNGPAVGVIENVMTLIVGDTATDYLCYRYDPDTGTVGERAVFGDVQSLDGSPDGATLDEYGGLWCALVGGHQLARFSRGRLDRTIPLPVANPTDVTFGGERLDRLYVVSIGRGAQPGVGLDGALLVIDGLGVRGRPEPRFSLA
jgi:sugar lactone lactonase YvrE